MKCKQKRCNKTALEDGFCFKHSAPKKERKSLYDFFMEIWDERDHKCFLTGDNLEYIKGSDRFVNIFAHVLPRGRYPHWKYEKKNVVLLRPDLHTMFDDGIYKTIIQFEKDTGKSFRPLFQLEYDLHNEYKELYNSPIMRKLVYKYFRL